MKTLWNAFRLHFYFGPYARQEIKIGFCIYRRVVPFVYRLSFDPRNAN
jgi:hypothetical protein